MAGEDPEYLDWLRSLPCCKCGKAPCREVHHRTGAGMGRRAHDHESMPLCHDCHMEFHDSKGQFKAWPKHMKKSWQETMVQSYMELWTSSDVF